MQSFSPVKMKNENISIFLLELLLHGMQIVQKVNNQWIFVQCGIKNKTDICEKANTDMKSSVTI